MELERQRVDFLQGIRTKDYLKSFGLGPAASRECEPLSASLRVRCGAEHPVRNSRRPDAPSKFWP